MLLWLKYGLHLRRSAADTTAIAELNCNEPLTLEGLHEPSNADEDAGMVHWMRRGWKLLPFIILSGVIVDGAVGYGAKLASPLLVPLSSKVSLPKIQLWEKRKRISSLHPLHARTPA
jgi:hypothetical protein